MRDIELYTLLDSADLVEPSHFKNFVHTVNMPTEVVVYKPEFSIPMQARVYKTHLYWHENKVKDYNELMKTARPFKGTSYHDEIMLVEVWLENGDDGHTSYRLDGWRYVPQSRLDEELNGSKWYREMCHGGEGLPTCMRWGSGYEERYQQNCNIIENEKENFRKTL